MGLLEDLGKFTQGAADSVVNFGEDASEAINRATRDAIQFAGSGVSANGRIFGPVADKFGSDPTAFCLNVAAKLKNSARDVLRRTAERTGRTSYFFQTPQGQRKVAAAPPSSASANQIALTLALAMSPQGNPAVMIEEAGRLANGLPVKPRGLMGHTYYPMGFSMERGLFGIDDAVLLGIVLPIIAAIALQVLPGLIGAASNVIQQATGPKGPSPEEQAAAAKVAEQRKQEDMIKMVAIGGVVLLLVGAGAFLLLRKKKAAA